MELTQSKNKANEQCYSVTIYFESELERNAFNAWIRGYKNDFEKWFTGMKKLGGTECMMCRWRDPVQAQCFDGHIQGLDHCVGYEGEP